MNQQDRHIVLGMPGYGKQTAGAGRGFWKASRYARIDRQYQEGSLLAANFNTLWCYALNKAHRGEAVDYFAMLHDDIGPEDYWLDKLIDELEAHSLDVLSVVVPIKDSRGLTSTALHRDGDNWTFYSRLSMRDVFNLPETFTAEDVGRPLLLNTGCWVAKWNQQWCSQVHFEINDRIAFVPPRNRYEAQVEPEDWQFSRLLHEIGQPGHPSCTFRPLRIGATRKIRLRHQGDMAFTNEAPWGRSDFDPESGLGSSPITHAATAAIPLEV